MMAQPEATRPDRTDARPIILALLTIVFFMGHLWYTHDVAYWLWELSGGIRKDGLLTVYGASPWAWTVPIHVPGGVMLYLGERLPCLMLNWLAMFLILGGSLAAGISLASTVIAVFRRDRPILGRFWWRLWMAVASWAWIPVPARMAWIYLWTVLY
jgi:hypothetical protein